MDALKRDFVILHSLSLSGISTTMRAMLIAFLVLMLVIFPEEKRPEAGFFILLFSIGCLVARVASQLGAYCDSAARLGIPGHAQAMRRAQCILIALANLLPIAVALWFGLGAHLVIIVIGSIAFAIYIGRALLLVIVAALALRGLAATGIDLWALVIGTPGSIVILLASFWVYISWLRTPRAIETSTEAGPHLLADAAHEEQEADELLAANKRFEGYLGEVLTPRQPEILTPRRLWLGLGHDQSISWRAIAIWVLLALLAMASLHFWKNAKSDFTIYVTLSIFFGASVFGGVHGLGETWLRTAGEQSLLVLTPRWPTANALRTVLLRSVWPGVPQLLTAWLVFSAVTAGLGWIRWHDVAIIGVGQLAVLISSIGIFVSNFAHARIRKTNWLQMFYLLSAVAGIVTLTISLMNASRAGALVGAALILAPTALAFLAFFLRPVQFPVQIVLRR
jgi:hypothetical protein